MSQHRNASEFFEPRVEMTVGNQAQEVRFNRGYRQGGLVSYTTLTREVECDEGAQIGAQAMSGSQLHPAIETRFVKIRHAKQKKKGNDVHILAKQLPRFV